jgi:HAD superfamily hydrolase (TIGR01509 family)
LPDVSVVIPIGAVIFDMDGLMLDTERPALRTWKKVGTEFGFPLSNEVIFRTIGVSESECKRVYNEFNPNFPYSEIRREVGKRITEEVEREGIPLRPGLLTLLDKIEALAIPMGVATSTSKERAIWKLEKSGIKKYFSTFTFGDEVKLGKPAPDIFRLAAARLNQIPALCIGFEDSPVGLAGLHAAGIRSVFVKDLLEPSSGILATVWRRYNDLAEAVELF